MAAVVADTSPLIALIQIGHLSILKSLFVEVQIPPAVALEAAPSLPERPSWLLVRELTEPIAELDRFDFQAALLQGLLPLVVAADRPPDVLRAYASLYLDGEVRMEGCSRNVGAFARFLETISFSHAAVLNVANVSRECQVERKTIATYIEVLDDLLLSFRIPVFSRRAKRDTSTHPKFFLFDAGVFRSLRPKGPLDRPDRRRGARGPRRTAFARVARLPWR
jgi:predicted AAA+ superfamily ATPase